MSKEDKPLEYQRRIRDTKGVAQRLDLNYLRRPAWMAVIRSRLTWVLLAVAVLVGIGVGAKPRAVSNGPLARSHAMFENRCEVCHTQAFGGVQDASCSKCHDGAAHTAHADRTPRCAECHVEHRGSADLAAVANGNCTNCHGDLNAHWKALAIAPGVAMSGDAARNGVRAPQVQVQITAFREGRHPEFSAAKFQDARPLRLNHAIHMPKEPKVIRGMKLPMVCGDCHVTDKSSPDGDLLPVTFEANCKSCHARELEFDVHHVLGPNAKPAPHTKDPETIRAYIVKAYRDAMAADPSIVRKPPLNELAPASMWLDRMVKDSEAYLFGRKCGYCHEGGKPMEEKAGKVMGRYPAATPWFEHGEFSHRAHRAVTCESCHTAAKASTKTADVLVPKMSTCLPCHGGETAGLDRCSECHLYHDRKLEKEPARRPVQTLTGGTP